jgi:hypothetical protein
MSFVASAGQLQGTPQRAVDAETAAAIGLEIARATAHFRPDLRAGQAELMTRDFIQDLGHYRVAEIQAGFAAYRREASNRFFPRPGQIIELIEAGRRERAAAARDEGRFTGKVGESRPLMWWFKPKKLWATHWSEDDIPQSAREFYFKWKAAKVGARA